MCNATYKPVNRNAYTCEVPAGQHEVVTDEYGTYEIHAVELQEFRGYRYGAMGKKFPLPSIPYTFTWDDHMPAALTSGDGSPAHAA